MFHRTSHDSQTIEESLATSTIYIHVNQSVSQSVRVRRAKVRSSVADILGGNLFHLRVSSDIPPERMESGDELVAGSSIVDGVIPLGRQGGSLTLLGLC
jgi:hypothetical protein